MNQIIMILLISLLVLVHEMGHFIAARMCGIRVTRFGIGMPIGPSWKLFRWGKTDFYLHQHRAVVKKLFDIFFAHAVGYERYIAKPIMLFLQRSSIRLRNQFDDIAFPFFFGV